MAELATTRGKEAALAALEERRTNRPTQIEDWKLPAGANMHFYCISCGHLSDVLPEGYFISQPKKICDECQAMKELGWLE